MWKQKHEMKPKPRLLAGSAVAALVFLLLISELTLRFAFGFGKPLLYAPDERVGYLPAPSQDLHRFGAVIRINTYGMRSDEVSMTRAASRIRLLFIGDSVTFGTTYVDQSRIFTELIKSALSTRYHQPVEVLNASAGGWAPENEYQYLVSRGTFDSSAVVLVINTNDLDQPFAGLEASPQFPTANPKTAIQELWTRYLEPRLNPSMRTADPGSDSESAPDADRALSVTQVLERASAFSKSRGAQFIIIFSPADYAYENNPAWIAVVRNLGDWANRAHVELIDMSPVYARYSRAQIYLDNIHLKPFGHELVAAEFVSHFESALRPLAR